MVCLSTEDAQILFSQIPCNKMVSQLTNCMQGDFFQTTLYIYINALHIISMLWNTHIVKHDTHRLPLILLELSVYHTSPDTFYGAVPGFQHLAAMNP